MRCQILLLFAAVLLINRGDLPAADTHILASGRQSGDLTTVNISLEVGGELKVVSDSKIKPLKMSVVATMAYDEMLFAGAGEQFSSVRYYDRAEAVIKIEQGGAKPILPETRRLICANWDAQSVVLSHAESPLTREELDLISLPADSLVIDALLPEEPVAVGESWSHAEPLLATLLRLDAVSTSDVKSVLKDAVAARTAQVELAGKVEGALDGVSTTIELKGRYTYDFAQRRITGLVLLIKENRSVGHVSTGLDVVSKLQMTVGKSEQSEHLTKETLAQVSLDSDPLRRLLAYESIPGGFRLLHDRRWHAVSDDPKLLTMRFVDRGDLLAQCNVSPLAKAAPGQHVTLSKFQTEIVQALSDKGGQILKAAEENDGRGWTIYRVIASGTVSELPIVWHYYLVADTEGRQIAFAFTLEEGLAERFADADRGLVDSVGFIETPVDPDSPPATIQLKVPTPAPQAEKPTPAAVRAPAKTPVATKPATSSPGKSSVRFRN